MTAKQRKYMVEVMPLALICALLALFLFTSALDYGRNADQLHVLEDWTVRAPVEEGGASTLRMQTTLPAEADGGPSVCFYSIYQTVRVQLDGEEIYRFDVPAGEKLLGAAPSNWNSMALPEGSGERTLTIELTTPYRHYASRMPQVLAGSAEMVESFIVMKTVPRLVAALAVLFIGLVFAIVAIILRYYVAGNTGLYSLSLFIVVLAIFLAAQQTSLLLKINSGVSYILLQNIALMLCPVMYSWHLSRMHTGKLCKFDRALCLVSLINLLLVLTLQFLTRLDVPQMMVFTRFLCAALILYELILELQVRRRLLVCLFAALMIYAIVRYYITDTITWLVYVAIFAYLYIVIYRVISTLVRSQAKQIRLEAALEVSRSEIATIQITSHFFYHTLDSIRALIRMDADKAYKMAGDFAKYVRYRVDGVEGMEETVPFSRELRSIRAYTDIKQAQLGERFRMNYDVETEDFEILPLTVQPLVENAVIHAVQRRREGGEVRLVCRETGKGYHIEVIDNGPGAGAKPEIGDEQKKSVAIKNVNTRLEFYGIAPIRLTHNELGGITASLDTPKKITRKGRTE
ncbi:MAG: histidine kinase [Eubacteriales bacterium]|nr:histidine kinase [Eubacteriales bacterium]